MKLFLLNLFFFNLMGISTIRSQLVFKTNGFITYSKKENIKVVFMSENIIHVIKYQPKNNHNKKSLSVILAPDKKIKILHQKKGSNNIIYTRNAKVSYNYKKKELSFFWKNNLKIKEVFTTDNFSPVDDDGNSSYKIKQLFDITSKEVLYGLGQHQSGKVNMRNQTIHLQQKNMEISIPIIQSTKNYLIYWDNYSATYFKDSLNQFSFTSDYGKCIDYYVVLGKTPDEIMENYVKLTGKPPLLPLWSFGYIQSRERYKNPSEMLDVVRRYRKLNISLDAVVQDWKYWGIEENDWNSIDFKSKNYENVKSYIDSIHNFHAKIMVSVWPSFGINTDIYKELQAKKMLYENMYTFPVQKNVKIYDAFNPEARNIYWKYMDKNLFQIGVDSWWLDAVEPVQKDIISGDPNKLGQELFYKDKSENSKNIKTYLGSFQSIANAYPLITVQGVFQNQRKVNNHKRALILTRSAFAGQQRNAAVLWSGDITASWKIFHDQIPAAINMSYSGIQFWNTDIGGFYSYKNFPNGLKDNHYHELYLRWFQFAVFTSMLRAHGTNVPREIYQFGNPGDISFDILHKYINLRYKLIPYIYSNAYTAHLKGSPIIKGLAMSYPKDTNVYKIDDAFIFGNDILVSPILKPIFHDSASTFSLNDNFKVKKTTYLPVGNEWYDYWNNKRFHGGTKIEQNVNISTIPLFIKSGSILPEAVVHPYTQIKFYDTLNFKIFSGKNGSFTLYEDEGDNYNYEKGVCSTIFFVYNEKLKSLRISKRNGHFPHMSQNRFFTFTYYDGEKIYKTNINYKGKSIVVNLIRNK